MKLVHLKCDSCGLVLSNDERDFRACGNYTDCNGKVYDICPQCEARLFAKVVQS